MEAFEPKDFEYPPKKPSLDSVIRQKRRQVALAKEQQAFKVGPHPTEANPKGVAGDENVETTDGDVVEGSDNTGDSSVGTQIVEQEPRYTEMEQKMMDEARDLSLVGHLTELRHRIIIMAIAIVIGSGIAFYYVDVLLALLVGPAGKLYYMRPTEAFFTYMKVAVVGGIILASPVILYQIWMFIVPALTTREKRLTNWIIPVAVMLFAMGIIFSYTLVLPAAVKFFIGFGTDELEALFSIGQYIDFVIAFILPFGLIFELPLVLIIMGYFNLINSMFLKSKRKIFILLSFIIGAAISPTPDMFSQTMIALPMICLYEISVFVLSKMMKK